MDAFWTKCDNIVASFRHLHDFEFNVHNDVHGTIEQRIYSLRHTMIHVRAARTARATIITQFIFRGIPSMIVLGHTTYAIGSVTSQNEIRFSPENFESSLKDAFVILLFTESALQIRFSRRCLALDGHNEMGVPWRHSLFFYRRCEGLRTKLRLEVDILIGEQETDFLVLNYCESYILYPTSNTSAFQPIVFKKTTDFIRFVEEELSRQSWMRTKSGIETVNWGALLRI